MSTKHTPGPWSASAVDVFAETPGRPVILRGERDSHDAGLMSAEQAANARLAAAAPELLEALKKCVQAFRTSIGEPAWAELTGALDAIRKAEGES